MYGPPRRCAPALPGAAGADSRPRGRCGLPDATRQRRSSGGCGSCEASRAPGARASVGPAENSTCHVRAIARMPDRASCVVRSVLRDVAPLAGPRVDVDAHRAAASSGRRTARRSAGSAARAGPPARRRPARSARTTGRPPPSGSGCARRRGRRGRPRRRSTSHSPPVPAPPTRDRAQPAEQHQRRDAADDPTIAG